jgi:hypothetical protein
MKIKKVERKLSLNKNTIAILGIDSLNGAKGGVQDPEHTLATICVDTNCGHTDDPPCNESFIIGISC